jgi:hypothetical protein
VTQKTLLRVLLAFKWVIATCDLKGFQFLLPRGWKRRYPPLDPVGAIFRDVLEQVVFPEVHQSFLETCCAVGSGFWKEAYSGGVYIQEPFTYGNNARW